MSSETTGAQDVPERPATDDRDDDDTETDASDERDGRTIGSVTAEPGPRRTSSVELLKIEAQLVAEGHEPDNPATPVDADTGEAFFEQHIEDSDLVPAWTRPWENGGDEDV